MNSSMTTISVTGQDIYSFGAIFTLAGATVSTFCLIFVSDDNEEKFADLFQFQLKFQIFSD